MKRECNMEIEGLIVEISYNFIEGDKGDYWTPPTNDKVKILGWRLLYEEEDRELNSDLDDSEWEDWMRDIDHYVHNDSVWDILEFENDSRDEY